MKMCKVMRVNRSSYYSWFNRKPSVVSIKNKYILDEIINIHKLSKGVYGSPTIQAVLNKKGIKCSRPRVARLMKKNLICSIIKRKYKITTDSKHTHNISPNLLKTAAIPTKINELWVADISYVRTGEGWLYLSAIMDLYSRKIISWTVSNSLSKEIVTKILWSAIKSRKISKENKLIFHSDRGLQYASNTTRNILKQNKIIQSMSGKGNCYDNAHMESFFHTLKVQQVYTNIYKTREEAKSKLFWYIEIFYNRTKPHSSLNNLTPEEFEQKHIKECLKVA